MAAPRKQSRTAGEAVTPLGRPRDPAIDDAILEAARSVLLEVGYARLSFELVARRANVTRPTIYRRWPSKMHLVHEAAFPGGERVELPDTGRIVDDIRQVVRNGFAAYARPEVRAALPGLLADLHDDAGLRHEVLDRLDLPARAQFAELVDRARRRGEIHPEADAAVLFDVLYGSLFHRVVAREELSAGFADALSGLLLHALGVGEAGGRPPRMSG
jgi:AcrR family transcriptional regulator